ALCSLTRASGLASTGPRPTCSLRVARPRTPRAAIVWRDGGAMPSTIDLLAALADVDDQIRHHSQRRDQARALVGQAKEAHQRALDHLARAEAALASHAEQERQTERKVRDYQGHHQRAVRALET